MLIALHLARREAIQMVLDLVLMIQPRPWVKYVVIAFGMSGTFVRILVSLSASSRRSDSHPDRRSHVQSDRSRTISQGLPFLSSAATQADASSVRPLPDARRPPRKALILVRHETGFGSFAYKDWLFAISSFALLWM